MAWTVRAMLLAAWLLARIAQAQGPASATPAVAPGRQLEIIIEQRQPGGWAEVDAANVFDSGAELRFRVRTNFPAHLFLTYVGSSGRSAALFPNVESGLHNRLEAGVTRLLPESNGVFRVSGPAGVELLQWVATPLPAAGSSSPGYAPLAPPPAPGTLLHTLVPRCDDAMFRGGEPCRETRAPGRDVQNGRRVADNNGISGSLRARDIDFVNKPDSEGGAKVIVRASADAGAIVYEMRIVHR